MISASDTRELAVAMGKTASVAGTVGSSFEATTAMLAQMIETTRSAPEEAGTALKTILTRMAEIKKNPLEIIDVEGEEASFNKIDKALKEVGVEMKDANMQFKNFDEILFELADKWDGLDKNTQLYLSTQLAGQRQANKFLAVMSDTERLAELYTEALNSEDAGLIQFAKTMDSVESKLNQLNTGFQQFYMGILSGTELSGVLTIVNNIVDSLTKIPKLNLFAMLYSGAKVFTTGLGKDFTAALVKAYRDAQSQIKASGPLVTPQQMYQPQHAKAAYVPLHGAAPVIDQAAVQQATGVWAKLKQMQAENKAAIIQNTNSAISGIVASGAAGVRTAGQVIGTVASGLMSAMGIVSGVLAAIGAIQAIYQAIHKDTQELQQEAQEAKAKYVTAREEAKDLNKLITKYKELSDTRNESNEKQEEWLAINNELADKYPELISHIDEEGNAIIALSKDYAILAEEKKKATLEGAIGAFESQIQIQQRIISENKQLQMGQTGNFWEDILLGPTTNLAYQQTERGQEEFELENKQRAQATEKAQQQLLTIQENYIAALVSSYKMFSSSDVINKIPYASQVLTSATQDLANQWIEAFMGGDESKREAAIKKYKEKQAAVDYAASEEKAISEYNRLYQNFGDEASKALGEMFSNPLAYSLSQIQTMAQKLESTAPETGKQLLIAYEKVANTVNMGLIRNLQYTAQYFGEGFNFEDEAQVKAAQEQVAKEFNNFTPSMMENMSDQLEALKKRMGEGVVPPEVVNMFKSLNMAIPDMAKEQLDKIQSILSTADLDSYFGVRAAQESVLGTIGDKTSQLYQDLAAGFNVLLTQIPAPSAADIRAMTDPLAKAVADFQLIMEKNGKFTEKEMAALAGYDLTWDGKTITNSLQEIRQAVFQRYKDVMESGLVALEGKEGVDPAQIAELQAMIEGFDDEIGALMVAGAQNKLNSALDVIEEMASGTLSSETYLALSKFVQKNQELIQKMFPDFNMADFVNTSAGLKFTGLQENLDKITQFYMEQQFDSLGKAGTSEALQRIAEAKEKQLAEQLQALPKMATGDANLDETIAKLQDVGITAEEAANLVKNMGLAITDFAQTTEGTFVLINKELLDREKIEAQINKLLNKQDDLTAQEAKQLGGLIKLREAELKLLQKRRYNFMQMDEKQAAELAPVKELLSNLGEAQRVSEEITKNRRINIDDLQVLLDNMDIGAGLKKQLGYATQTTQEIIQTMVAGGKQVVMESGEIFVKLSEAQGKGIKEATQSGVKEMIQGRIKQIDAQLAMLETLKKMEHIEISSELDQKFTTTFTDAQGQKFESANALLDMIESQNTEAAKNFLQNLELHVTANPTTDPELFWQQLYNYLMSHSPEELLSLGVTVSPELQVKWNKESISKAKEEIDKAVKDKKITEQTGIDLNLQLDKVDTSNLDTAGAAISSIKTTLNEGINEDSAKTLTDTLKTIAELPANTNLETLADDTKLIGENTQILAESQEANAISTEHQAVALEEVGRAGEEAAPKLDAYNQALKDTESASSLAQGALKTLADTMSPLARAVSAPLTALGNLVAAIRGLQSKTITVTTEYKTVGKVSNIANSKSLQEIDKMALEGYAHGTDGVIKKKEQALVGEGTGNLTGPETLIRDGRAYKVGAQGPELQTLYPGDVILNALETKKLNKTSGTSIPTYASGTGGIDAAIAALLDEKNRLQSMLGSLSSFLGGKGSGGGGGGGGKADSAATKEFLMDLEKWFNYLRRIEQLENHINILRAKRENLKDGKQYSVSLLTENNLLKQQASLYSELLDAQTQYKDNLKAEYLREYGRYFYFVGDAIQINADAILQDTKNNQDLAEAIESLMDDYLAITDDITANTIAIEENTTAQNANIRALRDLYIEMENAVLAAHQAASKKVIASKQKEIDEKVKKDKQYLDSLKKSIDDEKKMRDAAARSTERKEIERRLALLQRDTSGKSTKEIASLQEQLRKMSEEDYFAAKEKAITDAEAAQNKEVELMQKDIDLLEAINQMKLDNMQLYWDEVEAIISQGSETTLQYLASFADEYLQGSLRQQEDYLEQWKFTIDAAINYASGAAQQAADIATSATAQVQKGGNTANVQYTPSGSSSGTANSGGGDSSESNNNYGGARVSDIGSTLKRGSRGTEVTTLQKALMALGYSLPKYGADGKFEAETESAVKSFQRAMGVAVDGVVGKNTKNAFRLKGYQTGGLIDETGLFVGHGTTAKPELMLNSKDTQTFEKFINWLTGSGANNMFDSAFEGKPVSGSSSQSSQVTIGDINLYMQSNIDDPFTMKKILQDVVNDTVMKPLKQQRPPSKSRR